MYLRFACIQDFDDFRSSDVISHCPGVVRRHSPSISNLSSVTCDLLGQCAWPCSVMIPRVSILLIVIFQTSSLNYEILS